MSENLLCVQNLTLSIENDENSYNVVNDVSFKINKGEIVGLVGESGCGKSTTALAVADLLPEHVKIVNGSIRFKDKNILSLSDDDARKIKGKEISMIFQQPLTALNPTVKIGRQISETLKLHCDKNKKEIKEITISLMRKVGLKSPEKVYNLYPFELSGGMRQRVMIAMAVICHPNLIIADEPTTALDLSIQKQVIKMLKDFRNEYNMSILFISHDLSVIKNICDRIMVMYCGEIVECGRSDEIFNNPMHEYTKALISCIPTFENRGKHLCGLKGNVPNRYDNTTKCVFASRCQCAGDICKSNSPNIISVSESHYYRCLKKGGDSKNE